MSGASDAMQGGRWGVYAVRFAVYGAYGVLAFISKPGSRLLVPAGAAALVVLNRARLAPLLLAAMGQTDLEAISRTGWIALGIVALCVAAAFWGHGYQVSRVWRVVQRLLGLVLKLALLGVALVVVLAFTGYPVERAAAFAAWPLAWCMLHLEGDPQWIVVLALLPAIGVYITLSRLLTVVLGTFPPVVRPLPPLARLKATGQALRPVRVTLAVPPLT